MSLTSEALIKGFKDSEKILKSCGTGSPSSDTFLEWDYSMYRLGDDSYWAYGITWSEGDLRRSAKIHNGAVTDHYIIYTSGGKYRSAEVCPKTLEPVALYETVTRTYEPKIDAKTGAILQDNIYSSWVNLPDDYLKELRKIKFEFLASVYCYANKPYGKCVEFSTSWIQKHLLTMNGITFPTTALLLAN